MAVTNADLKEMIERYIPTISRNERRLDRIEPMTDNHEKILYGDKGNLTDEGMIGVINNLNAMVVSLKSWVKPLGVTVLGAAILGGLAKLLELIEIVDAMSK